MPKNNSLLKKIAICLTLVVVIIAWSGLFTPASSQDQSRINALEVDINGIESHGSIE